MPQQYIHMMHVFCVFVCCSLRVLFYAMSIQRDKKVYRSGMSVLAELKNKLLSSPYILEYKVAGIDTLGELRYSHSSSIYFAFRLGIHITVQIKQNLNKKTIANYIYNITVMLKKYV